MKLVTLMENEAALPELAGAWGLSLYVETPRHKLLFDMGPDEQFLENARKLGVDLGAVDTAVLSHGHSDHGGGLAAFCRVNAGAPVFVRPGVFGNYYAVKPGEDPSYIGLDPAAETDLRGRLVYTEECRRLDEELLLFTAEDDPSLRAPSRKLQEKTGEAFRPDCFSHEQNLLIEAEGRAVVLAGCAHRGIVSILRAAEAHLGRRPDAVIGGFHLFELDGGDPEAERLVRETGDFLAQGETVYCTGHCTGEWAYERLKAVLKDRLRPMHSGTAVTLP